MFLVLCSHNFIFSYEQFSEVDNYQERVPRYCSRLIQERDAHVSLVPKPPKLKAKTKSGSGCGLARAGWYEFPANDVVGNSNYYADSAII